MMERNNVCRDFEREIREALGGLVFETTIPRSVKFEEANARQLSIFEHAPKSPGAVAYKALTLEVMSRGDGRSENGMSLPRDLLSRRRGLSRPTSRQAGQGPARPTTRRPSAKGRRPAGEKATAAAGADKVRGHGSST